MPHSFQFMFCFCHVCSIICCTFVFQDSYSTTKYNQPNLWKSYFVVDSADLPSFDNENAWLFLRAVTTPPQFLTGNKLSIFDPKSKFFFVFRTIWCDIVRLFVLLLVKLVLQNSTWKENTNPKVSNWGYCAKFWMNAETEARFSEMREWCVNE